MTEELEMVSASPLIRRHGLALRYEATGPDSGAWVAAFHFAGPDVVAQGRTIGIALRRFHLAVSNYLEAQGSPRTGESSLELPMDQERS